jgi:hypothetical protein
LLRTGRGTCGLFVVIAHGPPQNTTLERMNAPARPQLNRWVTLVPAFGLLALAALFLREWWLVGYVADPETIAAYRFGSEAMVSHGGAKYRSAGAYATSALQVAGVCALLAGVFFAASRLKSRLGEIA